MALVTATDLREYMSDVSLSPGQMRTAQTVLDGVQQTLETYLNRPVQIMQVRERRQSNSSGDLVLTVTPIYKVLSLRPLGAITPTTMTVFDITPLTPEDIDRVWDTMPGNNNVVPGGIYVSQPGAWYTVEYIGGYNGYANDQIKLAILEVASRIMTTNHDDTMSLKEGIANEPSGQPLVRGWTDEELRRFDRLRRRTARR